MVVINKLNKMVKYIFMDGITAKKNKTFLYSRLENSRFFYSIIFDRGRIFVNHLWEQLITKFGIKLDFFTV